MTRPWRRRRKIGIRRARRWSTLWRNFARIPRLRCNWRHWSESGKHCWPNWTVGPSVIPLAPQLQAAAAAVGSRCIAARVATGWGLALPLRDQAWSKAAEIREPQAAHLDDERILSIVLAGALIVTGAYVWRSRGRSRQPRLRSHPQRSRTLCTSPPSHCINDPSSLKAPRKSSMQSRQARGQGRRPSLVTLHKHLPPAGRGKKLRPSPLTSPSSSSRSTSELPLASTNLSASPPVINPTPGAGAQAIREPLPAPPPTLLIQSNPGDALIYVDNTLVGNTSREGRLEALNVDTRRSRCPSICSLAIASSQTTVQRVCGSTIDLSLNLQPFSNSATIRKGAPIVVPIPRLRFGHSA